MVGDESSGSASELEFVTSLTKAMKLDPVNFEPKEYDMPESLNFEVQLEKFMIRKKQMEQEAVNKDSCPSDDNHRINGMAFNEDQKRNLQKILNLVGNGIKSFLQGNSKMAVNKLKTAFEEISKFPSTVFNNPKDYIWTKYAYFKSLIGENTYANLLHARKLLQELEKVLFSDAPIYHYAMAELLIKFHRFRLAENEIKLCQDSMKGHHFQSHNWPTTEDTIKETTPCGLEECLNSLIAKCGSYHKPDAVCKFTGCIDASSHPFPAREIFKSDPDFKGYVLLICQEGCKIQYHPLCWKKVKDAFSNVDKLSDKDCLGRPCVTPDCKNSDNEPSVIHKIEIIGPDGKVKSQCVPDHVAESKQKEIALSKKRLRLKSDEHKTEKQTAKTKPKPKKANQLNHAQSSEDIATSMKSPAPKESSNLQISGFIPAKVNPSIKREDPKSAEKAADDASQKDFICSYFHMLLTKKGPLTRKRFDEEWDKFYPNIAPFYSLVPEKDWVYNLLKNSKYFFVLDEYLYAREPNSSSTESKENKASSNVEAGTNDSVVENKPYSSEENAHIVSKMKEIEKDISVKAAAVRMKEMDKKNIAGSAINRDMNTIPLYPPPWLPNMPSTSSQMVHPVSENSQREAVLVKDVVVNNPNHHSQSPQTRPFSFGYFEDINSDNSVFNSPVREIIKLSEASVIKNPESGIVPDSAAPIRDDFRVLTPPVRWRDDVFDLRYPNQVYAGAMAKPIMKEQIAPPEVLIRRDGFCQTDPIPETKSKNDDHDEIWVQHMQLAVNDLIKKNKELMKSKEQMELAHKREIEALSNQILTMSNSYAEQIRVLKESQSRNSDEDRRIMAMEARIKVQEDILQSTREELRKKDFDLLDAKKYLGIAILERLERESLKQVQRLVAALAVLPCSGPDAEAVGQAMARWESAGDQASKAKTLFLEQCAKCQAILFEGYGSDSFQKLIIPIIEEPAGQCPLDKLALHLLSERENAESNHAKVHLATSYDRSPSYRMRPGNFNRDLHSGPSHTYQYHQSPTRVSMHGIPVSYGARPRETPPAANGETSESLQSWPSTSSIPNSTKSSSTGNAAALTCSKKLLMELKKAYPSRSDDELWYAVVSVRRNNKNSLSGLPIKRIVAMVGNVLDWWPEPSEGSMGLDKFIGWAADAANPSEESNSGAQRAAWSGANSSPKHETEKDDCCICLQPMSAPKTDLSCSHTFHTECIRKWLSKESVCPICRKFTRMADEFPSLK